jgi:hypothetical protein
MKARNFILILALTLGIGSFGATRGLAYMRATYNGVCGELDGLPGLLQRANLFESGTCGAPKAGKCSGPCTIRPTSGKNTNGKCVFSPQLNNCQCVAS